MFPVITMAFSTLSQPKCRSVTVPKVNFTCSVYRTDGNKYERVSFLLLSYLLCNCINKKEKQFLPARLFVRDIKKVKERTCGDDLRAI